MATMTAPKSGVKVRMYRQGLGDCFLLAFPGEAGKPFYVLIDCGVVVGQVPRKPGIRQVAQHIADSTDYRLDIAIATHQHWDHLSGFVDAQDIFAKMHIGEVWLAWTENAKDDLAKRLGGKQKKAHAALRKVSAHIGRGGNAMAAADAAWGTALDNVLGFLGPGAGAETTGAALGLVRNFSRKQPRYCSPGDKPIALPGVKNARVYVLGPPHDEQKIGRYNDKTSDPQTYHVAELTLAAQADFLAAALDGSSEAGGALPRFPFDKRHQIRKGGAGSRYGRLKQRYFGGVHRWRQIGADWLRGASALALDLDNSANNTSLAIAIELGPEGKVLLFPGDAQVGNWLSWHDQDWQDANGRKVTAADLLSRTVLYKVGHHGSHNATLRQRGLQLMTSEDLVAMVPLDRATAKKKQWPMPWPELRRNLLEATEGRILQVDDRDLPGARECPAGTRAKVWRKFQESVSGNETYFEITIA